MVTEDTVVMIYSINRKELNDMSPETILDLIIFDQLSMTAAREKLSEPANRKLINYFINRDKITKEPMKESELSQLNSIVNILQALYNSEYDSPISDADYETLQEMLIDSGIPRLVSDNQINDMKKQEHSYQQLRGSLNKIHYLTKEEKATNPSRKYLDDWVKSSEARYQKVIGKSINVNDELIMCQCKFDGASAVLEIDNNGKCVWLTRGDTNNNLATDVTHVLRQFNDLYMDQPDHGIKFEIMCTEEDKDKINELYRDRSYRNSRQVVTATLNSKDVDFKANYLYPVPLRIMAQTDEVEQIHPNLIRDFPTLICRLSERDKIREFGQANKIAKHNGLSFRTDGVVITLMNPDVQKAIGRENNLNLFEVAFKFTEETAYSRIKNVEFEVGLFGYVTPVLVVEDVKLKGNTINRISLSNAERFREMDLWYNDMILVEYDIIPYARKDEKCNEWNRVNNR